MLCRPVEILIDDHHIARCILLPQASDRGNAEQMRHAEFFHRIDVRPVIELMGRILMLFPVTGEKDQFTAVELPLQKSGLSRTERSVDHPSVPYIEVIDFIQSASADDPQFHISHHYRIIVILLCFSAGFSGRMSFDFGKYTPEMRIYQVPR